VAASDADDDRASPPSLSLPPGQPLGSHVHSNWVARQQAFGSLTQAPPLPIVHHPQPTMCVQLSHVVSWSHVR
jgi:hypothetical protein